MAKIAAGEDYPGETTVITAKATAARA
jgi:hypothetical protein